MNRKSEHPSGTVKRRKVATDDGTPKYELWHGGRIVAVAVMTGRTGVDHYPWDWHTVDLPRPEYTPNYADSLRSVVQYVEHILKEGQR